MPTLLSKYTYRESHETGLVPGIEKLERYIWCGKYGSDKTKKICWKPYLLQSTSLDARGEHRPNRCGENGENETPPRAPPPRRRRERAYLCIYI